VQAGTDEAEGEDGEGEQEKAADLAAALGLVAPGVMLTGCDGGFWREGRDMASRKV
jgi:hypothetical protein